MRVKSQEKTNQYINETELKSLIIRINNKSFKLNLSNAFKRVSKYITKYEETSNKQFKFILEARIVKTYNFIIKNRYKQLLLISDEKIIEIKKLIIDYTTIINDISLYTDEFEKKNSESFNNVLVAFREINEEMMTKNINLHNSRKTDIVRISKYIKKHQKSKSQKFKRSLREHIVLISERNIIDKESYERFGEMILLIIKNILKKPKFSGYTYRDEFYSDSTDKILRYLKNFNHKMISKITGQQVNSFSYLSQYVHHSILFIINTKKTEKQEVEKYVNTYNENIRLLYNETSYTKENKSITLVIEEIKVSLYSDIIALSKKKIHEDTDEIKVLYPKDYVISLDEYTKLTKLKELLNKQISVIRKRK